MAPLSRVLVVDDEAQLCFMIRDALEREGFFVETRTDPFDALHILRRKRFALLVADLKMPGMDGLELVRRGLEVNPDLVNIIVTGYADVPSAIKALRFGVADLLKISWSSRLHQTHQSAQKSMRISLSFSRISSLIIAS